VTPNWLRFRRSRQKEVRELARRVADLVIVGAGTVGGWASVFASMSGARDDVVLERDLAGQGASSRAAGVVRAQGGTPDTVRLGMWSIDFYRRQHDLFGTDSGFREMGYVILAGTKAEEQAAYERIAMQRATGLDVRWVGPEEIHDLNPTMAKAGYRGGSFAATDGFIDPPRNVRAYTLAMQQRGVHLRERTPFTSLRTNGRKVTGVETPNGVIATERVILTGGPTLRDVARAAGARVFVGGARHQVVVTEPHDDFRVERQPMMFDLKGGIYWRLEEGGLLWGMSNPHETPGEATTIDWPYLRKMERRLHRLVPVTKDLGIRKGWAATIEYTPDHLPILGPLRARDGTEIEGASIASVCGHGMMWGPAVARIAADLALEGSTDVIERPHDLGMDRFDDEGRSPFYDPVALPFPVGADE
jgi:sarcosine oxidase subunit beta